MTPVRHLPAPGLHNCRDLGGYAAEGGVTRFGVFLRSEAPCGLPPAGIDFLRRWGLGEAIDLRGEAEIAWRPSALVGVLPYRKISLSGGAETFEKQNLPQGPFSWDKVYIKRAKEHADWIRAVVTACAEAEGSVLFHCTTGKDRTGIISCCLLGGRGRLPGGHRRRLLPEHGLFAGDVRGHAHRDPDHPQGAQPFRALRL